MINTPDSPPKAGISFAWEHIAGYYMRMRKFIPVSIIEGDNVGPKSPAGYGVIHAELPNPSVDPEQRIIAISIENKSDYKSVFRAHLDPGLKSEVNEVIIFCEYQSRGLFGTLKPLIHVAGYPAGTWQGFFDAVERYASAEFRWPPPLFLYSPPVRTIPTNPFPAPTGSLNKNSFSP
jgi:hypothetical protein